MPPPITLPSLLLTSSTLSTPSSTRLQSLYTFTSAQQSSNPEGYAANVRWWVQLLEEALRDGLMADRLTLEVGEVLLQALEYPGVGRPKGIAGVIKSLLPPSSPPTLLPLPLYLSSPTSPLAPPTLTSRFIARPLWWALSQVNPFAADPSGSVETETSVNKRLGKQRFVHLPVLEFAANSLLSHWALHPPPTPSSRLFTLPTFRSTYSRYCFPDGAMLSEDDCRVLLVYLRRERGRVVVDRSGKVFKLLEMGQTEGEVTEADLGTISILTTLETLDNQIASLSTDIANAQSKAAHHLRLSQKSIALSYLRSKKQLEAILDKRVGSGEVLRGVLRGIDGAHGDVEIMAAYESSSRTLKTLLAHPSLSLTHIDAVTLDLSDALASQAEISQAITSGGMAAVEASGVGLEEGEEGELEEELRVLVEEGRREDEERVVGEKGKVEMERARVQAEREEERERATQPPPTSIVPSAQTNSPPQPLPTTPQPQPAPPPPRRAEPDWAAIDAAAEERKREEKERAVVERRRMEERRVAAE